jgi:hypothetical protein
MVEMPDTDDLERALAIRDHLAPLIRKRGEPWPVDGLVWIWEMAPWYMALQRVDEVGHQASGSAGTLTIKTAI